MVPQLTKDPVDVTSLITWISSIPFEEWPQQHRLDDSKLRPSMVTDLAWHDFGNQASSLVSQIMSECFQGMQAFQWMLSVVMPGHSIAPHVDGQASYWLCRVHVPLLTNPQSKFIVEGKDHLLEVGHTYRVDTRQLHAVTNDGETPRVHFMFDVRKP